MKEIISKCGYRCDLCLAYKKNIEKQDRRKELSEKWHTIFGFFVAPENIMCDGCTQGKNLKLQDADCPVRPCVLSKHIENCAYCNEYICEKIATRLVSRNEIEKKLNREINEDDYMSFIKPYESKERLNLLKKKNINH